MTTPDRTKRALLAAVSKACAGNASSLARTLGIRVQSIQQWKRIPADRLADVEAATGIPRAELRPDIFGKAAA